MTQIDKNVRTATVGSFGQWVLALDKIAGMNRVAAVAVAATGGDDWICIVGTRGIIEARANKGVVRLLTDTAEARNIVLDTARPIYRPFLLREGVRRRMMQPEDTLRELGFLLRADGECAHGGSVTGGRRKGNAGAEAAGLMAVAGLSPVYMTAMAPIY
ncbi:MAG: hypothetical protein ABSH21_05425 [Verrucomicrobiia bacterium]|jgi:hypothetical protein